ncbi:MAG TPA: diaminopimelate epimerase [Mycobacteriales bacterium]|nr:diaminopimelate epimerase [Mycobacteriales bacterium]
MQFVKGHGTCNDFVLLPPGEGPDELTAALVRALCDRRAGVGADGVLRVVRSIDAADVRWFMDYRNADGSEAEMCGNGIRVFARYLVDAGYEQPGRLRIATRAGVRDVDVPVAGDVTVDMGVAERLTDAKVVISGVTHDGHGWSMGNPHLVVLDVDDLDAVDLAEPPVVDPAGAYPGGVNVEVVRRAGDRHIAMRVHERGVGETMSCGTGACAAAVAAMDAAGQRTWYDVDLPGGRLRVDWRETGEVLLTGPAVLVAEGSVAPSNVT